MFIRRVFPIIGLVFCRAAFGESQQRQIKPVAVKTTSPASRRQMYTACCAVCHGMDGKGNGPAAEALTVPAVDLTILARRNGNRYKSDRVRSAIEGDMRLLALESMQAK